MFMERHLLWIKRLYHDSMFMFLGNYEVHKSWTYLWGNQLLYTQFCFAFQVSESGVILKMTAESWQTSQPEQPPGVSSVLFPPRNLGCLTKNRPNFPKATIIQPLSSPPQPKKHLLGLLFMSLRISAFLHALPYFPSLSYFALAKVKRLWLMTR